MNQKRKNFPSSKHNNEQNHLTQNQQENKIKINCKYYL